MPTPTKPLATAALAMLALLFPPGITQAEARSAAQIAAQGRATLRQLEAQEPRSRAIARHAVAVMVFPSIYKAGLVFGGESGNGVMLVHGRAKGFYNLSGGSWGLQIGGQKFSYVLFLMNDGAVRHVTEKGGFAAGSGPSVAVINKGAATEADTSMIDRDVYAFPFNQKGLMADLTLEGTKISPIHPR